MSEIFPHMYGVRTKLKTLKFSETFSDLERFIV
jgi:hypothetical protein